MDFNVVIFNAKVLQNFQILDTKFTLILQDLRPYFIILVFAKRIQYILNFIKILLELGFSFVSIVGQLTIIIVILR